MSFKSIEEIGRLRKRLGLTQKELAANSGVSQSLIAKIESGSVEPTYSKAQNIFEALENLRAKEEIKAEQIMKTKVISVTLKEIVKEVIKIMKTKSISQMPVMDKEKVCGVITESAILMNLREHPEKMNYLRAEEVMEETPPIVSPKAGQKLLLELLKDYPIVLVAEKGEIKGLISKTDVLGKME
ncbi:CBS domain-containing protein [Candidatus Woesearchaeota archaeon]|nr:CBS domain-containing protein [Candidatus Woesearchaeota archaeon]